MLMRETKASTLLDGYSSNVLPDLPHVVDRRQRAAGAAGDGLELEQDQHVHAHQSLRDGVVLAVRRGMCVSTRSRDRKTTAAAKVSRRKDVAGDARRDSPAPRRSAACGGDGILAIPGVDGI
jgi:hypothetical protein